MPHFGKKSKQKLDSCHPLLQKLGNAIIADGIDITIIDGYRNKQAQNDAFDKGASKNIFPESKHNGVDGNPPAIAFDIAPYPIDWDDFRRWYFLGGYVLAKAKDLGINIRWGGMWSSRKVLENLDFDKNTFNDTPHFELII
tara:strand:- start:719 stop:1141 length:423 start_codon:yes stop_codon:yes gene_type:complete